MRVTLHSTDTIVELSRDGQVLPARVWVGTTEHGIKCHAYITRIAVAQDLDAAEFEKDLQAVHAPLPAELARVIPARLIL